MIKILLVFLLFSLTALPQDDQRQNPNVELPDFVITGKDVINIQKAKKIEPEFISTVSKDFLKPGFSPEELELKNFPQVNVGDVQLLDSLNYNNGRLSVGAGRYTLPVVDFSLAHIYESGLFEVYALGKNSLAHVDNSERYFLNGGANLFYNLKNDSEFLPGTQIKLHADYGTSSYKFYASEIPFLRRTSHHGNFALSLNNLLNEQVIYGIKVSNDITSLKDENFRENLFKINAFARVNLSNFNIGFAADYKRQFLNISSNVNIDRLNDDSFDFIALRPTIGLNLAKTLKAMFGINYSKSGDNSFISPYASIGVKLDKSISLFGEFTPHAEFISSSNLLNINPYFNLGNHLNIYFKKTNVLNTAVKYEYDKYFQIDGGFNYFSANNLPYFKDSFESGRFDVRTVQATHFGAFVNLLFHSGPYGIFYGTVEFNSTKDTSNNNVPYYPSAKASLSYGYGFTNDFSGEAMLNYISKSFTDIENEKSLDPYIDLGLKFSYKILQNFTLSFQLNNLFTDDIYKWNGYKEAPLDLIGELKYVW